MVGFGVAAVIALGAAAPAAALADDPGPSPGPEPTATGPAPSPDPVTPSPDPVTPSPGPATPAPRPTTAKPAAPPVLYLGLRVSGARVAPGGSLTATVSVRSGGTVARGARLDLSGSRATVSPARSSLGDVTGGGRSVSARVTIPRDAEPGTVTLTARVTAAKAGARTASSAITVTGDRTALVPPGKVPAVTPSSPPGVSLPLSPPGGGAISQAVLPPVAAPQVAPDQLPISPETALRSGRSAADPLGSGGLAALQAGWLAALLAGNALLLTRLRWGRRRSADPGGTRDCHPMTGIPVSAIRG
ncbi:hypothetical protein ACRYCC_23755 [Actinomadura scrupuli]|uniref:hypothetical protein n=1 Tax=Actinomadura scrupuli TaxID=559629 RepID=UPI003D96C549